MYIRFISPRWATEARTHAGFFGSAFDHRYATNTPDWIATALAQELRWFDRNLDAPKVLCKRTGRQWRNGVCWFRDAAAEHISRARYICWLLGEVGAQMTEIRAHRPGTLVWSDTHQVVALAERHIQHVIYR